MNVKRPSWLVVVAIVVAVAVALAGAGMGIWRWKVGRDAELAVAAEVSRRQTAAVRLRYCIFGDEPPTPYLDASKVEEGRFAAALFPEEPASRGPWPERCAPLAATLADARAEEKRVSRGGVYEPSAEEEQARRFGAALATGVLGELPPELFEMMTKETPFVAADVVDIPPPQRSAIPSSSALVPCAWNEPGYQHEIVNSVRQRRVVFRCVAAVAVIDGVGSDKDLRARKYVPAPIQTPDLKGVEDGAEPLASFSQGLFGSGPKPLATPGWLDDAYGHADGSITLLHRPASNAVAPYRMQRRAADGISTEVTLDAPRPARLEQNARMAAERPYVFADHLFWLEDDKGPTSALHARMLRPPPERPGPVLRLASLPGGDEKSLGSCHGTSELFVAFSAREGTVVVALGKGAPRVMETPHAFHDFTCRDDVASFVQACAGSSCKVGLLVVQCGPRGCEEKTGALPPTFRARGVGALSAIAIGDHVATLSAGKFPRLTVGPLARQSELVPRPLLEGGDWIGITARGDAGIAFVHSSTRSGGVHAFQFDTAGHVRAIDPPP